jgi:hypothetical protein
VALSLTPGRAADIKQAVPLLDDMDSDALPEALLADEGYYSDALVATFEASHRSSLPRPIVVSRERPISLS